MGAWDKIKTVGKIARPLTPLKWLMSPFEGMADKMKVESETEYADGAQEQAADQAELDLREGDRHMGLIPLVGTIKGVGEIGTDIAAWGSRTFGDGEIKSTDERMDAAVAAARERAAQKALEPDPTVRYDEYGNGQSVDPSVPVEDVECEPQQSIDPSMDPNLVY